MIPIQLARSSVKTYPLIPIPSNLVPIDLKLAAAVKSKPKAVKKTEVNDFIGLHKPDKPPNSFFIFKKTIRGQIKKEYPQMTENELASYCGVLWKSLSINQKQQFIDAAKELLKEWHDEMEVYRKQLIEQQRLNPVVNINQFSANLENPGEYLSTFDFKLTLPSNNGCFGLNGVDSEFHFVQHQFPLHEFKEDLFVRLEQQTIDGMKNKSFQKTKKRQKLDLNLNFDRGLSSSMRNISAVCKKFKTGWTPTSAAFKEDLKLSRIFE